MPKVLTATTATSNDAAFITFSGGGGLTYWEEVGQDFVPVNSGTQDIGSTSLRVADIHAEHLQGKQTSATGVAITASEGSIALGLSSGVNGTVSTGTSGLFAAGYFSGSDGSGGLGVTASRGAIAIGAFYSQGTGANTISATDGGMARGYIASSSQLGQITTTGGYAVGYSSGGTISTDRGIASGYVTGTGSITGNYGTAIGFASGYYGTIYAASAGVALGWSNGKPIKSYGASVAFGGAFYESGDSYGIYAQGNYSVAIGYTYGAGAECTAQADGCMQIGSGKNTVANSCQFGSLRFLTTGTGSSVGEWWVASGNVYVFSNGSARNFSTL